MATIVVSLGFKLSEIVVQLVTDEVHLLLGVPDQIEKLQSTLHLINGVLVDAERRGAEDKPLGYLLKKLKGVMYDIDDILDDCLIEADKYSTINPSGCCSGGGAATRTQLSPLTASVSCGFPLPLLSRFHKIKFTHQTGKRITSLNQRLEEIWSDMDKFKLVRDVAPIGSADDHRRGASITTKKSSVVESDIVGNKIKEDTRSLVELLTKPEDRETWGNLLVYAILGTGGIGKTTLAQNIFADEKIKEKFALKMWVCVSSEYSGVNVLRDVITSAGGSHGGAETGLEEMIADAVRGKKFFLVLDDVWSVQVWEESLRNPLIGSCVPGSRVLITSRNEEVAMKMKAVRPYHRVDLLSPKDGWSLLCKKVLSNGEDEEEIVGLKDVGMKIIEKCDGLPLAIKVLGGVLCGKKRCSEWESVLENTAWSVIGLPEGISNALYLSYSDLSSHLKQCFLYCCLFPEDRIIPRPKVANLWIAEGFVKAYQGTLMEELGEEYYRELVRRNLLQPDSGWYDEAGCKMHDLLRSLGQFLAQDESLVYGDAHGSGSSTNSQVKLRRISIVGGDVATITGFLTSQESLRSLFLNIKSISHLGDIFNHLSRLRVLDLSGTNVAELAEDFLGRQIHLRYLNLSGTPIRKIPKNIKNIRNSQFLILESCENLKDLPDGIVGLHNLRCLNLWGTALEGMPVGLRRLQYLNRLLGFTLNLTTSGQCNLEELQTLSQLRVLTIEKLERAPDSSKARAAALTSKLRLIGLQLNCTPHEVDGEQSTEDDMKRIEDVYEELQPPPCLEELEIKGYFGCKFPGWMTAATSSLASVLPYLTRLVLKNCAYCEQLPPLGQLPNLDYVWIKGAAAVKRIGPEFLGVIGDGSLGVQSSTSFPRLETLVLQDMPNWEEWEGENHARAMPCLKILILKNCPNLKSLPEGLLCCGTANKELYINNAGSLRQVKSHIALENLVVVKSPNLERIFDLPALKTLDVWYCPRLQVVENLPSLQSFKLRDDKMDSFPNWLSECVRQAKPEKLKIWCNEELIKKICLKEEGREWRKIQHVDRVSIYALDSSVYVHYTKNLLSFTTNLSKATAAANAQQPSTSSGASL